MILSNIEKLSSYGFKNFPSLLGLTAQQGDDLIFHLQIRSAPFLKLKPADVCCPSSPCAYEAAGENKHRLSPPWERSSLRVLSVFPLQLDRQCLDRWTQSDKCTQTILSLDAVLLQPDVTSARRRSVSTCLILCHNDRVNSQLVSAQHVFFEAGAIFLTSRILPASLDCSVLCSSSHGWTSWSLSWVPTCEWAERRDESRCRKSPGGLLL